MSRPSQAPIDPSVYFVFCCKIILAMVIACVSVLLVACTTEKDATEGEIVTEPVTETEEITTQTTDALAVADQNTDYTYTDITGDVLLLIDAANEVVYATTPSDHDEETLEALVQTFYDQMPDVDIEKTEFACFKNAKRDPQYSVSLGVPAREYYECPQGITIPAQDAVNQAAAVIKGAFAPDCTIENAYVYYSNSLVNIDMQADTRSWVVLLTTTLADGAPCEFTVRIDAVTGALQRANYMGEYQGTSGSVTNKTHDPVTKDNYETYAAATLDYLRSAGLPVDESIAPIVTSYMTISRYAIVYTTTSGEHYQSFLYTDGSCATIQRCDNWEVQGKRTGTVEDMHNYTIEFK